MTDNNHPITPPPELVDQWRAIPEYAGISEKVFSISITTNKLRDIATQAARWGADQELEACCSWADATGWCGAGDILRDTRRSKPPSLKEQAKFAAAVLRSPDETCSIAELQQHWHTICNALEQLND